jgi:hypothetical protein
MVRSGPSRVASRVEIAGSNPCYPDRGTSIPSLMDIRGLKAGRMGPLKAASRPFGDVRISKPIRNQPRTTSIIDALTRLTGHSVGRRLRRALSVPGIAFRIVRSRQSIDDGVVTCRHAVTRVPYPPKLAVLQAMQEGRAQISAFFECSSGASNHSSPQYGAN